MANGLAKKNVVSAAENTCEKITTGRRVERSEEAYTIVMDIKDGPKSQRTVFLKAKEDSIKGVLPIAIYEKAS